MLCNREPIRVLRTGLFEKWCPALFWVKRKWLSRAVMERHGFHPVHLIGALVAAFSS